MITMDRLRQIDWQRVALWVGIAGIVWPLQYLLIAPMITLGASVAWFLKAVAKLGIVGIVLLFVPFIGWLILALWLVARHGDRQAERRHREQMAALGVDPALEPEPLWVRSWRPLFRERLY